MSDEKQSPSDIPKKKFVHIQMIGGVEQDIKNMTEALGQMKKEGKLSDDIEFIVTNDKIELRDIRSLMEEMLTLYKKYKELKDENK